MIITYENAMVIVLDMQERLMPHIYDHDKIVKNSSILLEGLKIFNMPIILNEQYPNGLGRTIEPILQHINESQIYEKNTFSSLKDNIIRQDILKHKKNIAIIFGIETHICILQTCLDLIANNIAPVLVTDCCSSRKKSDHDIALLRMIHSGVTPTTYESLLFELCKSSENINFKNVRKLIV